MEKKQKIGLVVYYTSLIIAIIGLALALFIQSDGSEESNIKVSNIRYMIAFYAFLCVISPGALVNEYCKGKYDARKFRLKLIALCGSVVIGTLMFVLVPVPSVTMFVFMLSLLTFLFVLTPSNGK